MHPTIWATKNAVAQEHKGGKLKMYVDFHSRCSKRGAFILDNTVSDPAQRYESMMIPKLMALNCVNFDFRECVFPYDKNGSREKPGGEEKDGQVRSSFFNEATNSPFTYTFDINYSAGHRINSLAKRYDLVNDKKLHKESSPVQDTSSCLYRGMMSPLFCPEIYSDVGQSLLVAMLDYDQINPITRLISRSGQSLAQVLDELRAELPRSNDKPSRLPKARTDASKYNKAETKNEAAAEEGQRPSAANREQRISMIRRRSGLRSAQSAAQLPASSSAIGSGPTVQAKRTSSRAKERFKLIV